MGGEDRRRQRPGVEPRQHARVVAPAGHLGVGRGRHLGRGHVVGEADEEGGRLVDRLPVGLERRVGDQDTGHQQTGQDPVVVGAEAEPLLAEHATSRRSSAAARPCGRSGRAAGTGCSRRSRRTSPGTGSRPPRTPASGRPWRPSAPARPPARRGRTSCRGQGLPARPRPRSRRSPARPPRRAASRPVPAAGPGPQGPHRRGGASGSAAVPAARRRAAPCRTRGARCGTSRPWSRTSAGGRTRRTRRPGGRSARCPPGRRSPAAPAS